MKVIVNEEARKRTNYGTIDLEAGKVYEVLVNTIEFADGKRESSTNATTTTTANSNSFASNIDDDFTASSPKVS